MKASLGPRLLLALAQASHRDAHRKTPFAQFRFDVADHEKVKFFGHALADQAVGGI